MDKGVIYEWGTIIVFRECGGFDQLPPKIPAQQKERKKKTDEKRKKNRAR